jgi:hypothetical protein
MLTQSVQQFLSYELRVRNFILTTLNSVRLMKMYTGQKDVFQLSIQLLSENPFASVNVQRIVFKTCRKTLVGVHARYLLFLPDFTKIGIS